MRDVHPHIDVVEYSLTRLIVCAQVAALAIDFPLLAADTCQRAESQHFVPRSLSDLET